MRELHTINDGWLISADPDCKGESERWQDSVREDAVPVPVPGVMQNALGEYHGAAWYYRRTELPETPEDEDLVIHFGAVDYKTTVYVNGERLHTNYGSERPFDVFVPRRYQKNKALIALRVVNPREDAAVDGLIRSKVPSRNIYPVGFRGGSCYNAGGITQPVTLKTAPAERIGDIYLRPDWKTGKITAVMTLAGKLGESYIADVDVRLNDHPDLCLSESYEFEPDENGKAELSFRIDGHQLWSPDAPNVYSCSFTLSRGGVLLDSRAVNTGFRDFRIKKGFFFLNGKRIYLKSAHTGNHMPVGINAPAVPGMEFRDFQLAKAAGFNCVRYIATMATPEQLDFCDRLGLMIYQECYASWCLADSPNAKELYRDSVFTMIQRDRNHPCLTIWGLLNETQAGDAFSAARDILPELRELDGSRLVLLNSGRWDEWADKEGEIHLGSVSNPGSDKWENVWGSDGTAEKETAGDYHNYMTVPLTKENAAAVRGCGRDQKPVFMSETGVGSQLDVITINREFERLGTPKTNPDAAETLEMEELFRRDWERFGCGDIYPDPIDFLEASNRDNAETRRRCFDVVRSNPRICGYNVTGLLDHALCGEGPITYFRDMKPGNRDAFADGFSPLRWCLFAERSHIYRGEEITLEAVLASEDHLPDGKYRADICLTDDHGRPLLRDSVGFTLPVKDREGLPALAIPVYEKKIRFDFPAGRLHFRAYLDHGGVPKANDLEIWVSDRITPSEKREVLCYSLSQDLRDRLAAFGISAADADMSGSISEGGRILVGRLTDETAEKDVSRLLDLAEKGARVVFLDRMTFERSKPAAKLLPLENGVVYRHGSWLYHHDHMIKPCPLTEGLKPGFMDWAYYDYAWPDMVIESDSTPEVSAAVFFMVGNIQGDIDRNKGHYNSGVTLAEYRTGAGGITLTTFPLIERPDNPVCARILYNLASN
ncbi:MAG: hypothetical protein K6D94_12415 [Clostridiales bacterium]|nr:hypothetical protein [Clostridiales bacterium]